MIYGLQPIYTQESRVLILGSMPSVMSLQKAQYYGNPQNAMWKILFSLLEEPFVEEYHARLEVILRHGIALWDIAYSCDRNTSADSKIRNVIPNNLEWILQQCPDMNLIAFNGKKAYELFDRFYPSSRDRFPGRSVEYKVMPSTSPANARLSLEQKQKQWAGILPYLTKI